MHLARRWGAGIVAVAALALGFGVADQGASAQAPVTLNFSVTENRVPGAAGAATITPLGNNQLRVDIRLTGLPPNGTHAAHFHTSANATCDNNQPVTYPLTDVRVDGSGVGTSTTTITTRAANPIVPGGAYLNVHQASNPPGQGVVCANVTANLQTLAAGPAAAAAPRTGTGGLQDDGASAGLLLGSLALAVLLLGGTGALAYSRRQR